MTRTPWHVPPLFAFALSSCADLIHIDERSLAEGGGSTDALAADAPVGARDSASDRKETTPDDSASAEESDTRDGSATTDGGDVADAADGTIESGTPADGPSDPSDLPNSAPGPRQIATSHLQLWLTADVGIECVVSAAVDGGSFDRVTSWADQSGHGRNAALQREQLGPQCLIAGEAHRVNGVDLPYFSGPSNGNVVDETLDVDLSFLANTNYTIFAVEKRWVDYADGNLTKYNLVLGTTMPPDIEKANPATCGLYPPNLMLGIGYVYYDGAPEIVLDQWCNTLVGPADRVPTPPPIQLSEHTAQFDNLRGHELWVSGSPVAVNTDTFPLTQASDGAIGRAFQLTTKSDRDPRFHGDIAEIIIYDSALEDVDRIKVEAYLSKHWALGGHDR